MQAPYPDVPGLSPPARASTIARTSCATSYSDVLECARPGSKKRRGDPCSCERERPGSVLLDVDGYAGVSAQAAFLRGLKVMRALAN